MALPLPLHEHRCEDQGVRDGVLGVVTDAGARYARARWAERVEEEVEQLDPAVYVESRAEEACHD